MLRPALLTVALLLVASFGVAEGLWTGRWAPSEVLDRAAARVADVPRSLGEWEGADADLDAREVALAKLRGHLRRTYTHRQTGETVTVMLLCGQPGPISVHTPDVCFQGQGSVMAGAPKRETIAADDPSAEFWSARFERSGPVGTEASVALWGWSSDGRWEAADRPRVRYARAPFLYKLYVIRPLRNSAKEANDPALSEFLGLFLPAARAALFRTPDAQ